MAAFQRLFRGSIGPAAAIGGAVLAGASTSVAHADDGSVLVGSIHPGRAANGEKLPIYTNPNDDGTVTLVVHHNPLSEHIATARGATAEAVGSVRGVVEQGVSRWIDFERSVEREIKQVVPKDENLTPGIIYVLVAGLTGSVLTRTRAFPVRFLAPPAFALAALPYFLPKTAHNLRLYVSDLEDKNAPDFAAKHDQFNQNLEMHWHMAVDRLRGVSHEASSWSSKAAESVESATGLRVSDALRRGQAGVEKAQGKVAHALDVARERAAAPVPVPIVAAPTTAPVVLQKVGTVVEQKPIAEIVVAVPAAEAPKEASTVEVPVAVVPEAQPKPEAVAAKPFDTGKRLV